MPTHVDGDALRARRRVRILDDRYLKRYRIRRGVGDILNTTWRADLDE
jgi:hypothetical protein